jgi:hypothetical protein
MKRLQSQNLENQKVQGALNEIGWLAHAYALGYRDNTATSAEHASVLCATAQRQRVKSFALSRSVWDLARKTAIAVRPSIRV